MRAHPKDYLYCSSRRLVNNFPLKLNNINTYLEIDDLETYLKENINEEKVKSIRANSKTGRPSGSSEFITKLERKTGRVLNAKSHGRPKE